MFASWTLIYAPVLHWVGTALSLYFRVIIVTGIALFFASFAYASYLTIEPYFRRRWPHLLVTFHRTLSGRFKDARVGRDVISGCLIGVLMTIMSYFPPALGVRFNLSGEHAVFTDRLVLAGIGGFAHCAAGALAFSILWALMLAVVLTVGRALLRRDWLAWLLAAVIGSCLSLAEGNPLLSVPAAVLFVALALFAANQFGILGLAVAEFVFLLIFNSVLTLDFSRWYAWSSAWSLTIVVVLATYGFRAALAGRPAFGHGILEDSEAFIGG